MNNTNKIQTKLSFLIFHLALLYLAVDIDDFSLKNIATVTAFTCLTACNYWLWLCPMNRVRDVSDCWPEY